MKLVCYYSDDNSAVDEQFVEDQLLVCPVTKNVYEFVEVRNHDTHFVFKITDEYYAEYSADSEEAFVEQEPEQKANDIIDSLLKDVYLDGYYQRFDGMLFTLTEDGCPILENVSLRECHVDIISDLLDCISHYGGVSYLGFCGENEKLSKRELFERVMDMDGFDMLQSNLEVNDCIDGSSYVRYWDIVKI